MRYTDWLRLQKEAQEKAPLSQLTLAWRTVGEHTFLDFLVDGASLYDRFGSPGQVGAFGHCPPYERPFREAFLGKSSSPWGGNRIPLLMCYCGDTYCGAVTAEVTITEGCVFWTNLCLRDIHFDPPTWKNFLLGVVFRFDRKPYQAALTHLPTR